MINHLLKSVQGRLSPSYNFSSPVMDYLNSGRLLTELKADTVKATIRELKIELCKMQKSLKASPGNRALAKKIAAFEEFIRQHWSLISPLSRIPPEIFEQIFESCARNGTSILTVCHVCHMWRAIIFSTPSLWSTIPRLSLTQRTSRKSFLVALQVMLNRSGTRPLKLHILEDDVGKISPHRELHPALLLLSTYAGRWEDVHLQVVAPHGRLLSTNLWRYGSFTLLHSLQLHIIRHSKSPSGGSFVIDTFHAAPRLRVLSLSGIRDYSNVDFPWTQLTKYTERNVDFDGLNRLHQLKNCEEVEHISKFGSVVMERVPETYLPCLRSLFVEFHTEFDQWLDQWLGIHSLFDPLTLPALQCLYLRAFYGDYTRGLANFIIRSQCNIRKFVLHHPCREITPSSLSEILRLMPLLTDLDISHVVCSIYSILSADAEEPLVPLLERLELQSEAVSPSQLLIVSRFHAGGPNGVCRLQFGRIRFKHPSTCRKALFDLEEWNVSYYDTEFSKIRGWGKNLRGQLNGSGDSEDLYNICPIVKFSILQAVFSSIENYRFMNVRLLYSSGLHIVMKDLISKQPGDVGQLGNRELQLLRLRAETLLTKWIPLFLADIPRRQWVMQGDRCLVYVTSDSDIWKSPDAIDIVRFGMKEDPEMPKYYWPDE
ncbi:hypothetical protein BDQ12DRAFT_737859 [Crucibulum laeve]|uniref:F-box domain-containing protein n=1 Tax=Crucibulum laeve TaxID=68775 RepID=A0A5C3LQ48_9AGAR|nr:hypothetical protein BDQ12DRAFT_737859 [Crucibulum laeve]